MYLESQSLRITIPCILWRHDCGIGHIVSFCSMDSGGYFPPLILMYAAHSDFLHIEQSCINNHQCDCLWGRISSYVKKKFNVTVLKLSLLLLHVISYMNMNRPSIATVLDTYLQGLIECTKFGVPFMLQPSEWSCQKLDWYTDTDTEVQSCV